MFSITYLIYKIIMLICRKESYIFVNFLALFYFNDLTVCLFYPAIWKIIIALLVFCGISMLAIRLCISLRNHLSYPQQ